MRLLDFLARGLHVHNDAIGMAGLSALQAWDGKNVESIIEKHLTSEDLETFRTYIDRKEELLTAQRACEDSEKNILL